MTVILWAFVLVSLVVWGRGTFCGWLCPFGALQEFIGKIAQALRIPQIKFKTNTNAKLKWIKYFVLGGILLSLFFPGEVTDAMVEAEPFKTAITLSFMRSWPYLTYAIGLLIASSVVYKFFCRFLCPFGACLAILGLVRIVDWLPRRKQCGTPCQTCRHSCDYQAIKPSGKIDYNECFQCMDCVVIYESDQKCAPLIFDRKAASKVTTPFPL
jgi:polyferredoxin